jgi:CheY-like chemotaxis protein
MQAMARILFVDDSSHRRDVFGQALNGWGYDVDRTCDGNEIEVERVSLVKDL